MKVGGTFEMNLTKQHILNLLEELSHLEIDLSDKYQIDGKRVPRVTEILSAMIHQESLMTWSNSLGWKRISYKAFLQEAADKGTYSHLAIEKYLKDGFVDLDTLPLNDRIKSSVVSCMDGFMLWWNQLKTNHDVSVVSTEETIVHKYFGGTCDCLLKIDGKYKLVDFKTSNNMNYKYGLQLAAYRYLFREVKNINLDQCMILMLSKTNHSYLTYELDLSNKTHLSYIDNCEYTFLTLLAGYMMRLFTNNEYQSIFDVKQ